MKAVIPAAGIGTRLRPHTHTVPKALLYVAGKPILGHIIDAVAGLDVEEIILVVGHMQDKIRAYVSEHYDLPIRAVVQDEPRGLGHAVYVTREAVGDGVPLMVILGDTIFDLDFEPILRGGENLIGVREVEDPRRFGVVKTEGDRIVGLVEKPEHPPTNLAVVGLYYMTDSTPLFRSLEAIVESDIRTKGEYQLTDALQRMLDEGITMRCLPIEGWFDCGNRETLLTTNRYLLDRLSKPMEREGSIVIGPASVDSTASLENSIVGPYASIAAGAVIRNSIVRDSIVGEGARVEHALLDRSLVGDHAVVREACRRLNVGDSSEVEWGS